MQVLYIGLFGAIGCISRYALSGWVLGWTGGVFPYGTLTVNLIGSFLLGLIMEGSQHSTLLNAEIRMGITVGLMGGFTTFSTFSYETVRLLEKGSFGSAAANILLSVIICLFAAALGIFVARHI